MSDSSRGSASALKAAHSESVAAKSGAVQQCTEAKTAYIEFTLEEEDGHRVADEPYLVIAPDGTELPGRLDANGFARIDGLDPGTCRITFPLRADKEWRGK